MRQSSIRPALCGVFVLMFWLAFAALPAARAEKFPEPSPYPTGAELDIKVETPKRLVVDIPGESHGQAFWYITYTVTNNGDKPFNFLPLFEMLADDGKIIRSDKAIPPHVFAEIKRREGNTLLESAKKIEGMIQPGEDQARSGVAIFPEPMARMGRFYVFVGGLSEEAVEESKVRPDKADDLTQINQLREKQGLPKLEESWWKRTGTRDPRAPISDSIKDKDGNPLLLHKTLQLNYHIAGDEVRPGDDEIHTKGKQWVMR